MDSTCVQMDNLQLGFPDEAEIQNVDDNCAVVANAVAKGEEPCADILDVWRGKTSVDLE